MALATRSKPGTTPLRLSARNWTSSCRTYSECATGLASSGRCTRLSLKDLAADIPVVCADGQVKEFAGSLLVLSDGLGTAVAAIAILAAAGTTGFKPFG